MSQALQHSRGSSWGERVAPKALTYLCLRLSKTSDTFSTLSPAEPFTPPNAGFMRGQRHPVPPLFVGQPCLIVGRNCLGINDSGSYCR
jgi:hypothetical protein